MRTRRRRTRTTRAARERTKERLPPSGRQSSSRPPRRGKAPRAAPKQARSRRRRRRSLQGPPCLPLTGSPKSSSMRWRRAGWWSSPGQTSTTGAGPGGGVRRVQKGTGGGWQHACWTLTRLAPRAGHARVAAARGGNEWRARCLGLGTMTRLVTHENHSRRRRKRAGTKRVAVAAPSTNRHGTLA